MLISHIVDVIEQLAPLHLQESYDNAGLIVGSPTDECTGVMVCVDVTPDVVAEAIERGCNLVVAHHPVVFKGLRRLTGATLPERTVIDAIRGGVAIYAAHTNLDHAQGGVNTTLAARLGVVDAQPLGEGPGVVGQLDEPLTPLELVARVKTVCGSPIARCSALSAADKTLSRVALCGGSGGSLIEDAIAAGAQAMITSDVRYHDFVDHAWRIFIIDIGHFESEKCTKEIFYHLLSEKFPNFAIHYSENEKNPINYL